MIDFRYHLVSLVAVLLALSIGIILGTGILGDPLLDDIRSNVEELERQLAERRGETDRLDNELQEERAFITEAEPYLLAGELTDEQVVIVGFEGMEGGVVNDLRNSIETAGGTVASMIEIRDRFRLTDQLDSDSLALITGSVSGEPDVLRDEASEELGRRLSAAARGRAGSGANTLLDNLVEADFLDVERTVDDAEQIPDDAAIVIVGGSPEDPPYPKERFTLILATAMAREGVPVIVVEPPASRWGLVEEIRDDSEAGALVATADGIRGGAPGAAPRIAAIMGLARAIEGEILHLGRAPGAEEILPQPTPAE